MLKRCKEDRESRNKCDDCGKERRAKKCNEKPHGSRTQTKEREKNKRRRVLMRA